MRLLTVDGGGTRGIIPARWLASLEAEGPKPLAERFDLLGGASIGAALVCALGSGMPARDLGPWLLRWGPSVFPQGWWGWVRKSARLLGRPRYSPDGLERALAAAFDEGLRFGDLRGRVLVMALSADRWCGRRLCSWREADAELRVRDVVRASTAAPTYFPAARLAGRWSLDGGLMANHPGPEALRELERSTRVARARMHLLALGTGAPVAEESDDWGSRGVLEWAPDLVEAFMAAQSARSHALCRDDLGERYHRAQVAIPRELAALDAPGAMEALSELAGTALEAGPAGMALGAFA